MEAECQSKNWMVCPFFSIPNTLDALQISCHPQPLDPLGLEVCGPRPTAHGFSLWGGLAHGAVINGPRDDLWRHLCAAAVDWAHLHVSCAE